MKTHRLTSPTEAEALGLVVDEVDGVEGSPAQQGFARELEKAIAQLPGLRTPRNPDGSGGTPPRPHQKRHATIAACRRQTLWAHSMGAGKSGGSICAILCRFRHLLLAGLKGYPDNALDRWIESRGQEATWAYLRRTNKVRPGAIQVIGPRHILNSVWLREFQRMSLGWAVEVITKKEQMLSSTAPIWVYGFDLLKEQSPRGQRQKAQQLVRFRDLGKSYFLGEPWAKVVARRWPPAMLVLDEVHRARPGTERTRCLTLLRRRAKTVLTLTGTPMDGWIDHVGAILELTYGPGLAFPFTGESFSKRFGQTEKVSLDVSTGREDRSRERPVPGISFGQIPGFLAATAHLIHRLNLQDPEVKANVVYPPVHEHLELIEMRPEHREAYQQVYRNNLLAMKQALAGPRNRKSRENMLAIIGQLRQMTDCPWAIDDSIKSTALVDRVVATVLKMKAEGRKGLIGTTFIAESRFIHEALKKAGIKGVRLYANDDQAKPKTLSAAAREELLEEFTDDPDCWYLIANKELVAEGLNLAETASYTVSCSHGWRCNVEEQWLARVARPGQQWPHVDAFDFVYADTIGVYIQRMLASKSKATKALIDLDFSEQESLSPTVDVRELAESMLSSEAS